MSYFSGTASGRSSPATSPQVRHATPAALGSSSTTSPPLQPLISPPISPTRDHSQRNSYGLHPAWSHKHYERERNVSGPTNGADTADAGAGGADGAGSPPPGSNSNLTFSRTTTVSSGQGPTTHTLDGTYTGGSSGTYRRKVGFETFAAPVTTSLAGPPGSSAAAAKPGQPPLFAYTLAASSPAYRRNRNTRVFLVAVSDDESGDEALQWLMESLVEDGDEIIGCRVVEMDENERMSPEKQEGLRDQGKELLERILRENDEVDPDRKISVIVEFVAGRVTQTIMRLISLYRPDSLIVGTKGTRSKLQTWGKALGAPGMGSVSRYCVSHSPVPVIVVRPERKVKKALAKRQNDPQRQEYTAIVGGVVDLSRTRSAER